MADTNISDFEKILGTSVTPTIPSLPDCYILESYGLRSFANSQYFSNVTDNCESYLKSRLLTPLKSERDIPCPSTLAADDIMLSPGALISGIINQYFLDEESFFVETQKRGSADYHVIEFLFASLWTQDWGLGWFEMETLPDNSASYFPICLETRKQVDYDILFTCRPASEKEHFKNRFLRLQENLKLCPIVTVIPSFQNILVSENSNIELQRKVKPDINDRFVQEAVALVESGEQRNGNAAAIFIVEKYGSASGRNWTKASGKIHAASDDAAHDTLYRKIQKLLKSNINI